MLIFKFASHAFRTINIFSSRLDHVDFSILHDFSRITAVFVATSNCDTSDARDVSHGIVTTNENSFQEKLNCLSNEQAPQIFCQCMTSGMTNAVIGFHSIY